jgi:hypothetical protein
MHINMCTYVNVFADILKYIYIFKHWINKKLLMNLMHKILLDRNFFSTVKVYIYIYVYIIIDI